MAAATGDGCCSDPACSSTQVQEEVDRRITAATRTPSTGLVAGPVLSTRALAAAQGQEMPPIIGTRVAKALRTGSFSSECKRMRCDAVLAAKRHRRHDENWWS